MGETYITMKEQKFLHLIVEILLIYYLVFILFIPQKTEIGMAILTRKMNSQMIQPNIKTQTKMGSEIIPTMLQILTTPDKKIATMTGRQM